MEIAERDGKPVEARKVMLFLNPSANRRCGTAHTHTHTHMGAFCVFVCRDAKIQFMKYSAPLFHLAGVDITVVEVYIMYMYISRIAIIIHIYRWSYLERCDVCVLSVLCYFQSQSEGHIRSLVNYIDPQTDCIVVAGGDGTLMEVNMKIVVKMMNMIKMSLVFHFTRL